jgi:glutamate formiminotransferase/formiminotetrahydrofolate cyclodeaminase
MNVKINASGCKDKSFTDAVIAEGNEIEKNAIATEGEIITLVNSKIGS